MRVTGGSQRLRFALEENPSSCCSRGGSRGGIYGQGEPAHKVKEAGSPSAQLIAIEMEEQGQVLKYLGSRVNVFWLGQVSRGNPGREQVRRKGGVTPSLLDKLLDNLEPSCC